MGNEIKQIQPGSFNIDTSFNSVPSLDKKNTDYNYNKLYESNSKVDIMDVYDVSSNEETNKNSITNQPTIYDIKKLTQNILEREGFKKLSAIVDVFKPAVDAIVDFKDDVVLQFTDDDEVAAMNDAMLEELTLSKSKDQRINLFLKYIDENKELINPKTLNQYIKWMKNGEYIGDITVLFFPDKSILKYNDKKELVLYDKDYKDVKKKYDDIYLDKLRDTFDEDYQYALTKAPEYAKELETYNASLDMFIDFVKKARNDSNIKPEILNSYIEEYEGKHSLVLCSENAIEFKDGTKIYVDKNGNLCIEDKRLKCDKTVYTEDSILKYKGNFYETYDKNGNLLSVRKVDGTTINFFEDLATYGGDQMFFKKKIKKILNDSNYLKIMQKYYPDADIEDVELFSYILCTRGCGYVAFANELYEYYSDKPEEFQKKFGFSMYSINSKGEIVSNINYLIYDLALSGYKDIPIEEVYGNIKEVKDGKINDAALNANDAVNGDADGISAVFNGINYEWVDEKFREYANEKDLDFSLDRTYLMDKKKFEKLQNEGKIVMISAKDFDLYVDKDNDGVYETKSHDNVGGHAMVLTEIDENGNYIVSSWGEKYKIEAPNVVESFWETHTRFGNNKKFTLYDIIDFKEK